MDNKKTQDDQVLFFDIGASVNHLTGNEVYFYSNNDAMQFKKNNVCKSHNNEICSNADKTLHMLNEKKDHYQFQNYNENNNKDNEEKQNCCKLGKNISTGIDYYLNSEQKYETHIYEEREKIVFEQEFDKVNDIYNVEEIMKIINNLNSIRNEIETAIYKKLEKKYKTIITNTIKVKEIENYLTNIKKLLADNINELKALQEKKYKESLNIVDLVSQKKNYQKIN
ncbi:conserved protein, unknown function, partial [Hepatocystis sp. ex Piliocolobus tephrosceles]